MTILQANLFTSIWQEEIFKRRNSGQGGVSDVCNRNMKGGKQIKTRMLAAEVVPGFYIFLKYEVVEGFAE